MGNQEHAKRLKQGVEAWNTWRKENPAIRPDLSETDLSGADLSGADLHVTHLRRANLRGADLSFASLLYANLRFTDLSFSDLGNADLRLANLLNTNLNNADVTYAHFLNTAFAGIDLNRVKGLDRAIHEGPSTIHINSVVLPTEECIRNHFLQGIGFTRTQIEYLPSLLAPRPIQYHSLFISYTRQDEALAKQLHADLRKNDVPCWFAPEDMKIGEKIRSRIDESIYLHEKLLLILSKHSVISQWVEHEVETALNKEDEDKANVLFPIRLDDAVMKSTRGWASHIRLTRHIGDFTNWQDDEGYYLAFIRLLQDLKLDRLPIL